MRLAVLAARRRARQAWNVERRRRRALESMRAVVAGTPAEADVERLARRHLVEAEIRQEFFWRGRTMTRARLDEARHLHTALASGRPLIVSFCHHGPNYGLSALLARYGRSVHMVLGERAYRENPTPEAERYARQVERLMTLGGGRAVRARGSYDALAALLARGEILGITFDIQGRTPTRFLGRTLLLTSGTTRLAARTDALVLPLLRTREGHRLVNVAAAPLDPRDFDDPLALHQALACRHEAWIMADPAALHMTAGLRRQLGVGARSGGAASLPSGR